MGRTINLHRAASSLYAADVLPSFQRPDGLGARAHAEQLIKASSRAAVAAYADASRSTSVPLRARLTCAVPEQPRDGRPADDAQTYCDLLRSHDADFDTLLVDDEGYPRADIDVALIRTARARIVRLRNDLYACNAAMATALEESLPARDGVPPASSTMDSDSPRTPAPFAVVNSVAPGSPAEEAGLCKHDRILRFGAVSRDTPDCLPAVARLVADAEGAVVPLLIERDGATRLLGLTPRQDWGGRGLLGCVRTSPN